MEYTNPHSCRHCEKILLSRPEDDPDLHEGSEPRQSLILLRYLSALRERDDILKKLEWTFLHEVHPQHLDKYVSDGCLLYKFIATGMKKVRENRTDDEKRIDRKHTMEQTNRDVNQRKSGQLISITLYEDAVEIKTPYDASKGARDSYLRKVPRLLHHCVFGVLTSSPKNASTFSLSYPVNFTLSIASRSLCTQGIKAEYQ